MAPTRESIFSAVLRRDKESAEKLLRSGANPNWDNEEGKTLLHMAINNYSGSQDEMDIIKMLLRYGGKADFIDDFGYSPLELAILNGSTEILRVLLERQEYLNHFDCNCGETFLTMCCQKADSDVLVEMLLSAGANVFETNENDYNALQLAAASGFVKSARLLMIYTFHSLIEIEKPEEVSTNPILSAMWQAEKDNANDLLNTVLGHTGISLSRFLFEKDVNILFACVKDKETYELSKLLPKNSFTSQQFFQQYKRGKQRENLFNKSILIFEHSDYDCLPLELKHIIAYYLSDESMLKLEVAAKKTIAEPKS